jgi:hypothetical protein
VSREGGKEGRREGGGGIKISIFKKFNNKKTHVKLPPWAPRGASCP